VLSVALFSRSIARLFLHTRRSYSGLASFDSRILGVFPFDSHSPVFREE